MRHRRIQMFVITGILLAAVAVSANEVQRGALRSSATPLELLGAESADRFKVAVQPDETIQWEVYVPKNYSPAAPPGLLVFISPTESGAVPRRYQHVLDESNLIWIGANRSGNDVLVARRVSFAVFAVALALRDYEIDRSRVYVSGFSGGGRTASSVAIAFAHIFKGALYIAGVDPWGDRTPSQIDEIRANRYVFLTGSKDFNRRETRRIHRSYRRADVRNTLLMDIKGMDHRMPSDEYLAQAIGFLDGEFSPGAAQ